MSFPVVWITFTFLDVICTVYISSSRSAACDLMLFKMYLLHLMQVELFCRPVENQHMHLSFWSSWWQQWQLMNWPLSQAARSSLAVKAARCIYTLTSDIISGQYDLARFHSVLLKTISDSNKTSAITKVHRCISQIKLKGVGVFFKNEAVFLSGV